MEMGGSFRFSRASLEGDALWSERPFDRWRARFDLVYMLCSRDDDPEGLKRGELMMSLKFLSLRWGWSAGRVRSFLSFLVAENFLVEQPRKGTGKVYLVACFESFFDDNQKESQKGNGNVKEEMFVDPEAPPISIPVGKPPKPPGKPPPASSSQSERDEWERRVVEAAAYYLPAIPQELRFEDFENAWRDRLLERAEKLSKGKLTFTQVRSQFRELVELFRLRGPEFVVWRVRENTRNGYTAISFKQDFENSDGRLFQPEERSSVPEDEVI